MEVAKNIYFLSDFHLGAPNAKSTAQCIFIVGDLFDFWYEYKKVVPKGYVRILGKLAELTDTGIAVHFFVGNHDMWMKDYFQKELNIPVYFEPKEFSFNNKTFLIGHGDGLGPGDAGYKFIKKIFRNPLCDWLFGILPPSWGIGLADYLSRKSRAKTGTTDEVFLGEEKEWLVTYCRDMLLKKHYDYFIFGHRHLPLDIALNDNSKYINLGDWIKYFTYAVFDGEKTTLEYYK
jgi:UDP-2,3-diacylglucosamine hydrolase